MTRGGGRGVGGGWPLGGHNGRHIGWPLEGHRILLRGPKINNTPNKTHVIPLFCAQTLGKHVEWHIFLFLIFDCGHKNIKETLRVRATSLHSLSLYSRQKGSSHSSSLGSRTNVVTQEASHFSLLTACRENVIQINWSVCVNSKSI